MLGIGFGPQVCGQLVEGAGREWLVPDGLGGYAMGTVSGLRTRRYHGLLVVSGDTPAARRLGLVALDPVVTLPSGAHVPLAVHEWASGVIAPRGHELLEAFDLTDGVPRWRWRIGDTVLEREVATRHGTPTVAVVHRLLSGPPVRLSLGALGTWRDAHGERTAAGPPPAQREAADGVVIEDAYRLAGPGWRSAGAWFYAALHREEAARGLAAAEDLWHAGDFAADLHPGDTLGVCAWAGDLAQEPPPAVAVVEAARRRNRAVVAAARPADDVEATLVLAADAFVVETPAGPDVVAGYPWFGAWSRDTMLSYEGLLLATGREEVGRRLLRTYAATLSDGMLANTADTGRVEYNTVDGTLWFVHAVGRHVAATGDRDLAAELLPALRGVVDAHRTGKCRYGIRVDSLDGLLTAGAEGEALTWMDARVDGVPVTRRSGKPVEVNALWINALGTLGALAEGLGERHDEIDALAAAARRSFARRFPIPGAGWLYDVVDGPDGDDPALRPNQVLAWSLPYPAAEPDPVALATVGARLLTPLGLRTLAPDAAGYAGRHRGTPAERDHAYHMGTVWPWLIGPYADAARRAGVQIVGLTAALQRHLGEFGLGSVSETADGQPPHAATGCPFQAWSVAELLRVRRG